MRCHTVNHLRPCLTMSLCKNRTLSVSVLRVVRGAKGKRSETGQMVGERERTLSSGTLIATHNARANEQRVRHKPARRPM